MLTTYNTRKLITLLLMAALLTPVLWFTCYGQANAQGPTTQIGADIDGEAEYDESGESVSLNAAGDIVAIGARYNDDAGSNAGQVRVYRNQSGTWTQIGADIDGEAADEDSGRSVSLNAAGDIVAIGAVYNSEASINAGQVRVYQYQSATDTWTQIGADINGEAAYDQSGLSVSLNAAGDIVAIGAYGNSGTLGPGSYAGQVRVYRNQSGAWTQIGADIDGEAAYDFSGWSVSLNATGDIVAIGAPNAGFAPGQVRVYQNQSGAWTQIGADIDGEAADDKLGESVSLNAAGDIVAIGAPNAGSYAGQVRVYQNQSGTWTQIGADIDGEAADDESGYSVSLNAAGDIVAIGAHYNDGAGEDAGQVRVFGPAPEMDVQGNGVSIAAGDTTPATADDTDFSTVAVGSTPVTHTFTISNSDVGNLTLSGTPAVTLTTGTHFNVTAQPGSTTIISNSTTTFQVTFDPSAAGSFTDTVNIVNNDSDENPYTFVISGTGTADVQPIFLPIIFGNFTPGSDLVVDDVVATTGAVTVTIRNAGTVATPDAFWVDVYFNPNPAPPGLNQQWEAIAQAGAHWGVTATLNPGESLTLTIGDQYYVNGSSSFPANAKVYAYVDSINYATTYGNVQESNEANNVFGPVVSTAGAGVVTPQIKPASLEGLPER